MAKFFRSAFAVLALVLVLLLSPVQGEPNKRKPVPDMNGNAVPTDGKHEPAPKDEGAVPDDGKIDSVRPPGLTREMLIERVNRLAAEQRPKYMAIVVMKDQDRLAKVAMEDKDMLARGFAASALTDQKLLAKIAGEAQDHNVRFIAVRRITGEDQPSLLKLIATMKDNRDIAVAKVKDPELRAKLRGGPYNPNAGDLIKNREEEEARLILSTDKNLGDRQRAIDVSVNVPVLFKAAMEEPGIDDLPMKRLIELRKTGKSGTEDKLFEEIALKAKSFKIRRVAVGVVSNKAILAKAAEDPDAEVRSATATRLSDPALLAKLARDPMANVRSAAISRLTDAALLQKLADADPDTSVRVTAEDRLKALKVKKK